MTLAEAELIEGTWTYRSLTERLLRPMSQRTRGSNALLLLAASGTLGLLMAIAYTFSTGIGTWGNNIPVAWAFAITNFVWWIGIGHAGTFISAILLLLEQKWRSSLNRVAEAMTLFALVQAASMPLLHLGRPWFFYWLVPYPATMRIWPQFMSALPWDIVAVGTYSFISLLFWYHGAIPDFAAVRDWAGSLRKRRVYGLLALGWQGSARQWRHYKTTQLLLAGLATPLVLSVHSVVGMDFSTTLLPGWHTVLFPPYFVAGAIFSGFAMVIMLIVPIRAAYRLGEVFTTRHIDLLSKMLLVTGHLVIFSYLCDHFIAYYSGDTFERFIMNDGRPFTSPFSWAFWTSYACNIVAIQPLWFKSVRRRPWLVFAIACLVQLGMWLERFMLIISSQAQDFLPSSWNTYVPSFVDGTILSGSICFFLLLFLLMLRYVPFIPIAESKEVIHELGKIRDEEPAS